MARENTPETRRSAGWKRVKTASRAALISPSVQRTRAAATEAASKLPSPRAAEVKASRAASTAAASREALRDAKPSSCWR